MKFTKDDLKKALTFYVKMSGDIGDVYAVLYNFADCIGVTPQVLNSAETAAEVFFYNELHATYDIESKTYTADAKYFYNTNVDKVVGTLRYSEDVISAVVQKVVPQDIWACKVIDCLFDTINVDAVEIE